MNWSDVERSFARAAALSFSRKKMMLAFPALALCGILAVFCRALSYETSDWMSISLAFLPILLSSGVLLGLGVLLVRIHMHEIKQLHLSIRRLLAGSIDLILGTSYLAIPPVLIYLLLWMVLGIFFLLREIPGIGSFFSVVFAFGPFLLIFSSLLLCLFNLALLFFIAPAAAFQPLKRVSFAARVLGLFEGRILSSMALFLLALLPIALIVGLLVLSAQLTQIPSQEPLSAALTWFFIMIPFAGVLTPAVIFFFNFAAESYQLLHPKSA